MIPTSPKWMRFKESEVEAEFQRRYHLRAGKHTQLLMLAGVAVYSFGAFWSNNPWYVTALMFVGPVIGWLLCEWKWFHKYAQSIGTYLYAVFFIGYDFMLSLVRSGYFEGQITYLAIIHIYVAYTMLRLFFVPSILLAVSISAAHVALLWTGDAQPEVLQKAIVGLTLANVIGAIISYQFERNFRRMFAAKEALTAEKDVHDRFLDNILPNNMGARLRNNFDDVIVDCPEVVVISADLANFTAYSSSVSARQLVRLLNRIYSEFDELAVAHNLAKVKTMGDAILLVSGIHYEPDVERCLSMGIAMRDALHRIAAEEDVDLDIRIGMAVGTCQAGVVGETRPKFDIWGPAVTSAEKMEKQSRNGEISIDRRFRELLSDSTKTDELLSQLNSSLQKTA